MTEIEALVTKKFADRYLRHEVLGQGTYGVVYKATDTETGETVAIKKIRLGKQKEGVNFTALREIKLLKELKHFNIIKLTNTFPNKANLHLVFEYMESDLEAVIRDTNIVLSPADIKSYLQMTLKGLAFCHKNWILHRDVKPNNLLIGDNGQLKLGDFGLARIFGSSDQKLTHQVFSRWYRAPELMFGAKKYGTAVDIWAVACVFAELLLRRPFLQGNSDLDQIGKIYAAFGTPTQNQWPDMIYLPAYVAFEYVPAPPLRSLFPTVSEDVLDLLSKMFSYDPNRRISAQQALEHRYFSSVPPPTEPAFLPKPGPRKDSADLDDGYFNQGQSPLLSPRRKSRRVLVQQDDDMECGGQTIKRVNEPTAVDFSIFATRPAIRPTITSADRRSLKRKLDLEFQLAEFDH